MLPKAKSSSLNSNSAARNIGKELDAIKDMGTVKRALQRIYPVNVGSSGHNGRPTNMVPVGAGGSSQIVYGVRIVGDRVVMGVFRRELGRNGWTQVRDGKVAREVAVKIQAGGDRAFNIEEAVHRVNEKMLTRFPNEGLHRFFRGDVA